MSLEQLTTLDAIGQFLDGTQAVVLNVATATPIRQNSHNFSEAGPPQWLQARLHRGRYTPVGEYINCTVAQLPDKLHIEFTKSRPRHSNDNGLVESKNGSVIRKLYGYTHIPQQYARDFIELNSRQVYRYVNFHRPCYFPTTITDDKGKQRKKYRSLAKPSQYLKPGITFRNPAAFANEMTDNEVAEQLNSARDHLFQQLHERLKIRA